MHNLITFEYGSLEVNGTVFPFTGISEGEPDFRVEGVPFKFKEDLMDEFLFSIKEDLKLSSLVVTDTKGKELDFEMNQAILAEVA